LQGDETFLTHYFMFSISFYLLQNLIYMIHL
jgi:hypothetical protein